MTRQSRLRIGGAKDKEDKEGTRGEVFFCLGLGLTLFPG